MHSTPQIGALRGLHAPVERHCGPTPTRPIGMKIGTNMNMDKKFVMMPFKICLKCNINASNVLSNMYII